MDGGVVVDVMAMVARTLTADIPTLDQVAGRGGVG